MTYLTSKSRETLIATGLYLGPFAGSAFSEFRGDKKQTYSPSVLLPLSLLLPLLRSPTLLPPSLPLLFRILWVTHCGTVTVVHIVSGLC